MNINTRPVTFEELRPLFSLKKEKVDFTPNSKTSYIGAFDDQKIVGVIGWQMIGHVLRYKSAGVLPAYRGRGIYSKLWDVREQYAAGLSKKKTTAFCTPDSLPKFIKEKFFRISKRGTITFVER